MEERAQGVLLRWYPLTETSLIVHWLTRELGKLKTVAKGARRLKSNLHGKLDLFFEADFTFHRSRRTDLHALREIRLQQPHLALRKDLGCYQQASYFVALIDATTEPELPLPGAFELLSEALRQLPIQAANPVSVLAFEARWLGLSGYQPDLSDSLLSEGSRQILERSTSLEWESLTHLKLSLPQQAELNHFLRSCILHNFGMVPVSRNQAWPG
jgi:DNA repair protein RecO (recombination protein O)